jgi:hypothetical protein
MIISKMVDGNYPKFLWKEKQYRIKKVNLLDTWNGSEKRTSESDSNIVHFSNRNMIVFS